MVGRCRETVAIVRETVAIVWETVASGMHSLASVQGLANGSMYAFVMLRKVLDNCCDREVLANFSKVLGSVDNRLQVL